MEVNYAQTLNTKKMTETFFEHFFFFLILSLSNSLYCQIYKTLRHVLLLIIFISSKLSILKINHS